MFGLGKGEIDSLVQQKQRLRGNTIPVNKCIRERRAIYDEEQCWRNDKWAQTGDE